MEGGRKILGAQNKSMGLRGGRLEAQVLDRPVIQGILRPSRHFEFFLCSTCQVGSLPSVRVGRWKGGVHPFVADGDFEEENKKSDSFLIL